MAFTAWDLFIDLGLAALLLLAGQWLRASLVIVQRLFVPASVLAGLAGLALGPGGFALLPFSTSAAKYPAILILLVFAALPFASRLPASTRTSRRDVVELGAYSVLCILLQWGLGVLFGLTLLRWIWPDLPEGFGTVLAAGFVGGPGTAAAIGADFAERGWNEAGSLAMSAVTAGLLVSIAGGLAWVSWAAQKRITRFVSPFAHLPPELRTGLVDPQRRRPLGQETFSPVAIDTLTFHLALVAALAYLGYAANQQAAALLGKSPFPGFCAAFLVAVLARQLLSLTGALHYVDPRTSSRLCGAATDFLVVFGIASIDLGVLARYALPLLLLFGFGVALCWALFLLGARVFGRLWFEKALYTWGWATGVMAIAISLLRTVDPDNEGGVLDDFALAYLVIGPVEMVCLVSAPLLIGQGLAWTYALVCAGLGAGLLAWALRTRPALPPALRQEAP
ncbi:MAG: sodium:glutamate symporter [Candidatus Handelsmanbacteria bacterium]|nr:sodium:glutamate symporter [Candidatus Handelsmanbacteria bacterium]